MSAVSGVKYAQQAAGIKPINYLGPEWEGKVRAIADYYTAASLATASTIKMGILRPGEVFLAILIVHPAFGSGATISIGDADSATRFLAATSVASAGTIFSAAAGANVGLGYKNTGTSDIVILGTTAEEWTGTLSWVIFKACPN